MEMQKHLGLSQHRASALLSAYCHDDALQMSAIRTEARRMCEFYAGDPAESERLELLSEIALELQSSKTGSSEELDPYIGLLIHLAYPGPILTQ